ncbi:hypothetical protein GCM10009000_064290 [Halobacterium noricense]
MAGATKPINQKRNDSRTSLNEPGSDPAVAAARVAAPDPVIPIAVAPTYMSAAMKIPANKSESVALMNIFAAFAESSNGPKSR